MRVKYREVPEPPFKIRYPKDFEKTICAGLDQFLIYDRFRKVAHCTACGETWSYKDSGITIRKGDRVECPKCKEYLGANPHTCHDTYTEYNLTFIWNERGSIRFAAAYAFYRYDNRSPEETESIAKVIPVQIGSISPKAQKNICLRWDYAAYRKTGKDQYNWRECVGMFSECSGYYVGLHPKAFAVLDRSFMKRIYPEWISKYPDTFLKTLALFAKYPSAEYINKAGSDLKEIIANKIYRTPSHIYPNWQAKTLPGFLRLSAQDIDKLRAWGAFNIKGIAMYKQLKKHRKNPKREQFILFCKWYGYPDEFTNKHSGYYGMNYYELALYWERQSKKIDLQTWRIKGLYGDYIRQLKQLEYPLDEYYRFPKNLQEAHDRVSEEYNRREQEKRESRAREIAKQNAKKQAEFEKTLLPALEEFVFDDGEYVIFPLRNHEEFLLEGKMQHNCVASYYERAIKGATKIFVMRLSAQPNTSLITIELSTDNKSLKQVFAQGNRIPEPELRAKVDYWHENVVMNHKTKKARKTA